MQPLIWRVLLKTGFGLIGLGLRALGCKVEEGTSASCRTELICCRLTRGSLSSEEAETFCLTACEAPLQLLAFIRNALSSETAPRDHIIQRV